MADSEKTLKEKGNDALAAKNYNAAIEFYTEHQAALLDAEKCIELNPNWPKGYSRKGAALYELGRLHQALEAYRIGLSKDPNQQTMKEEAERIQKILDAADRRHTPITLSQFLMKDNQAKMRVVIFLLNIGIIINTIAYMLPLGNIYFSLTSYKRALICAVISYILAIGMQYGRPRMSAEYFAPIIQNPTSHNLILCVNLYLQRPHSIGILLILLPCLVVASQYLSQLLLVASPPLRSALGSTVNKILILVDQGWGSLNEQQKWNFINQNVPKWCATIEIALGFILLLEMFTPLGSFLGVLIFWQYMRMKAMISETTKLAFRNLYLSIYPIAHHRAAPSFVGKAFDAITGYMHKLAQIPRQNESPSMGCTIM